MSKKDIISLQIDIYVTFSKCLVHSLDWAYKKKKTRGPAHSQYSLFGYTSWQQLYSS